ncbi:MAG: hypothetical protein GKS05_02495 [Nitrospirales bacterium]|nr:hypothetical protein [Nitrospirales bacterium]
MLQSASITQTTETMEGLSVSSLQVAQQSESAAHRSQQASQLAQEGALMVQQAMDEILSMKDRVQDIAGQISHLSDHTGKIGNITKLVSDLANQTNLLALNAAVEAARAGEHGKGFGVVAGEIRKLADQSKASAEKIHTLLEDIQRKTDSTVSVTQDGMHTAEQAVQMARHAADKFSDVRAALDLALENAQQISLNVKQQATAVKQAVDTMSSIRKGAQETAAGLHETRAGIQTLNDAAHRLKAM